MPIPWSQFALPLVLGLVLSWLATGLIKFLSARYHLYKYTTQHQIDNRVISRLGGIAIWLIFLTLFLIYFDLTLPRLGLLLGMTLVFLMGVLDDLFNLPASIKLACQLVAVIVAVSMGVHIGQVTNPLGGVIVLTPVWDFILSVGWLMVVVNALNVLDGLDGLAAGASSIFAIILFFLSFFVVVNQPDTALMAVILLATLLGFLIWNWYPAKIFMGDSGSNVLGFLVGGLAMISGAKIATAALVLGFPILDLLWATWRRVRQGRSPFSADREHLHHRLLDSGVTHKNAVVIILSIVALFGVVSLLSGTLVKIGALLAAAILMIIFIRTIFSAQRRKNS